VHVKAERTSVGVRGPGLHQLQEALLQVASLRAGVQVTQHPHHPRRHLRILDSRLRIVLLFDPAL
jgi:hypothetical protein